MEKIIIILLSCIVTALAGKLPIELSTSVIKVEVVENINQILLENPQIIELNKESFIGTVGKDVVEAREVFRYTVGEPHPTYKRLAEAADTIYFQKPQDFQLQLTYPEVGVGGIVKFVEILVDQSSNIGKAYIIAGGLNENFIRIIVEAKQIYQEFHYRASFYGH